MDIDNINSINSINSLFMLLAEKAPEIFPKHKG